MLATRVLDLSFFVEAGFKVTGSDNPIYPPMDKIIANLNITPDVGFKTENIEKNLPDFIILANVVSRLSAALKKNDELEEILNQNPLRKEETESEYLERKYICHILEVIQ